MKKIYTVFKLFVATALIFFAGKANAEVTTNDLVGTYKFTATLTINDDSYNELLTDEFTFQIVNNSGIQITGFIVESQSCYAQLGDGQLVFNQQYMDANGIITLSNINGDYPYGTPPILPTWNVDNEGNITIPDFTVIKSFNHQEQTAEIAAKYTDCKVTKQAATEEDEKVNFTGTYTVAGTKWDYTGDTTTSSTESFTLSINEDGIVTAIAGYDDLTSIIGYGYVIKGATDGNKFVINVEGSALTLGAEYDVLGDVGSAWSSTYDSEGTIELSLENGEYSITDFSVWNYSYSTQKYTLKYYWSNLTVTKEGGKDVEPEPAVNVAGTYTVTGKKWDYTNGIPPTSDEQATFTLSIDEEGNVYEIAGYKVPDVYGAQGVYGKISENSFVILPVGNSSLSLGAVFDKLGDDNANAYNDEGSITLNYSNGTWTMSDFSVWQFDWSTSEYTLKYYWSGLTVTKVSDEVSISTIAPEAAAKANDGKFIENGKIVIIRNGVKYNVNGVAIK